jgi:carbonic anhydrase
MVMRLLLGHERFRTDFFENERELFEGLVGQGQHPQTMYIGCSDSRVVPNLIFNARPGELFVLRNIANIVPSFADGKVENRSVGAAIEYAVHVLRVEHLIVCGHTECGGLRALLDGEDKLSATPTLAAWLHGAAGVLRRLQAVAGSPEEIAKMIVYEHVVLQLENLLTYDVVKTALEEGRLEIHGWVYDLATGTIRGYDPENHQFRPLRLATAK